MEPVTRMNLEGDVPAQIDIALRVCGIVEHFHAAVADDLCAIEDGLGSRPTCGDSEVVARGESSAKKDFSLGKERLYRLVSASDEPG